MAAAEFEGTAQVEVAQIERGDDECSPYSYRPRRPEAGVEVSPAGEELVQQLGTDLSVRFPRLTLRGVVVIGPASAQVEPAPLGGELAPSPLCRREVGLDEQLRHPSILGRRRTRTQRVSHHRPGRCPSLVRTNDPYYLARPRSGSSAPPRVKAPSGIGPSGCVEANARALQ